MADVEVRPRPRFGADVRGVPTTAKSPVGGPSGPRGIPCAVLCPVPPPPPPAPLVILSVTGGIFDFFLRVTFDRAAGSNGLPPWDIDPPPDQISSYEWESVDRLILGLTGPAAGVQFLVIPLGPTNVWARDDGGVVPAGSYPRT